MLRIIMGAAVRNCDGISRRAFLQAGLLGVGGLTLADFFALRAQAAAPARKTNVILLWCSGGPGHMETWDPKPEAPDQFRGPFGAIRTNVPGVLFGELMPVLARMMDKVSVVRTVNHGTGDHTKANHWMLTGFEGPNFNDPGRGRPGFQRRPALGSAVAKLRGPNAPGMPPYVAVPNLRGGTDNLFHYATYLGAGYNPFVVESDPNAPTYRVRNLSLSTDLSHDRLGDRRHLLDALDETRRLGDSTVAGLGEHYQRAFDLLTSRGVGAAFDVNAEPDRVRDRYGRHTFGQSALVARRLVEAGVTFVTVNMVDGKARTAGAASWDHHGTPGAGSNSLKTAEGAKLMIPPLDVAIAALVEDLSQRGLDDTTLVVAMGEFGRTPRMNRDAGRDHWGRTFSVLMAGGGLKMGQVIGRSNARGEYPVDRPVDARDVAATVYRHLGIDSGTASLPDALGRPVHLLEGGQVIHELLA
jgi:uncharacterized protein (DUF1501 family)